MMMMMRTIMRKLSAMEAIAKLWQGLDSVTEHQSKIQGYPLVALCLISSQPQDLQDRSKIEEDMTFFPKLLTSKHENAPQKAHFSKRRLRRLLIIDPYLCAYEIGLPISQARLYR